MRRLFPGIAVIAGIILLGLGIGWLADSDFIPNPVFSATYQVDLAGLSSRLGILAGLSTLSIFIVTWAIQRHIEQKLTTLQNEHRLSQRRFFQRLDHELKNPLTIIRLGLVNLQQSPDLNSEQGHSLERISVQVQRLQKLVVDLRLLYELDASRVELKPVSLREVLEEAIELSSQAISPARQINMIMQQMPWPVSDVTGDRDLLVLVFRNLLDNALKFSRDSTPWATNCRQKAYTASHGGRSCGSIRHWQPVRVRYSSALSISRRACTGLRPRVSCGSRGSTMAHCSSVRSVG